MNFETSMGGGGRRPFPETDWSLVMRAGDPARGQQHLERLMAAYWRPAYCYIRATSRRSVEDAKDITQAFFTRLLEKGHLDRLDRDRGSFRSFLRASLSNFLVDTHRREAARRPSGKQLFLFDAQVEESLTDPADPEALFEREWNRTVLTSALRQLAEQLRERPGYHEIFSRYTQLEGDASGARPTYAELGASFGLTEGQVYKRLAYCRALLGSILRAKVGEYLADASDVEAEIQRIMEA